MVFRKGAKIWAVVVTYAFNPNTWEADADRSEFDISLVYRVSTRTVMLTQRNSASKINKNQKQRSLIIDYDTETMN